MNLAELTAEVVKITNRPDRTVEIESCIYRALQEIHFSSVFYFDLQELAFPSDGANERVVNLPARFREFKIIRTDCKQLQLIPPEALVRSDVFMPKENSYYRIGSQVRCFFSHVYTTLYIQYFRIPQIADSWIAINTPWAIVYSAAAKLFAMNRDLEQARYFEQLAGQQKLELLRIGFSF